MSAILVVDDEEAIRSVLRDLLSPYHKFQATRTVHEAKNLMETIAFNVVLADISLPDGSGVELLGLVRQLQPNTPVIIISGIDDAEYSRGLMDMGAFAYLTKPFHLNEVLGAVERAIESRRFSTDPDDRRIAPRYLAQVEARLSIVLVFDHVEDDDKEDGFLMVAGYTQDISETGLGIVVPEGSLEEQTLIGSTFHIVLGLDAGALDIEARAVRYEQTEKGHLIGVQITNMNGRDRVLFLKYLYQLGNQE